MPIASSSSRLRHAALAGALGAAALLAHAGAATAADDPTFARDIAPILQQKCESCHRVGQMAPMPLVTYEEVRPWARSIKSKVVAREMPPWHIDKTVGIQEVRQRHLAQRRADRHHCPLGRQRRPARRRRRHAAAA